MADIEHALRNRIRSSTDVTDVVATRVFPIFVPQGQALPALVYQLTSGEPVTSNSGHSGLTFARFEIECLSSSYSEVKDLAEKVRLAITGYSGTEASVKVTSTVHLRTSDDYTPPVTAGERGTHHAVLDFRLGYESATS